MSVPIALRALGVAAALALLAFRSARAAEPADSAEEWLSVSAPRANVRAEPRMGTEVLWSDPRGTPYRVLRRYGFWVSVQAVDGAGGWVHRGLLASVPAALNKKAAALLRDAAPAAAAARKLKALTPLRLLTREGGWIYAEEPGGVRGWVSAAELWGDLDFAGRRRNEDSDFLSRAN